MTAPAIIQDLVNRFRDSRELYRSGRYNEAQLRQEFLNPLFEALGWDMYNRSNFAPQYREVIHEDSLEDQGSVKAPDYAFRIGTTRKFFVEAKKPAVDIRYDIHPAYQLRRYAWNAHLPLSILTDFEELAVYDCRTRPDPGDSAATGRVMLFTFEEYLTRWDELAQTFSKDAVWKGSFDRYAEGSKGKRGTTEVDAEFLKEIEQWRLLLARNIALRNFRPSSNPVIASEAKQSQSASEAKQSQSASEAKQSQSASEAVIASEAKQSQSASEAKQSPNLHRAERQLNYAVQTTIDRILFLRICEDRKIEPTDQLLQIADGTDIYAQLLLLFQKADQKYNSGLFHFNKEKGQTSEPDTFTPTLQIDDKVLRQIIKSTYYPCPYMFNEIPVEILGQVYEQFLGSVIRLTPGGQAKVEEKPEVRKAGGVYYTPSYIVDYIVQNTLGRLLGDPAPVPVSNLPLVPALDTTLVPVSSPSTESDRQVSSPETPTLVPVSLRSTPPPKAGVGVPSTVTDHQVSNPETPPLVPDSTSPLVPVSRPSTETDRQVSTSLTTKEQLTPAQALNLRVVDPACGSGSFLLGAYQYLLDWHLNYYLSHDPQSHTHGKNPPLVATDGGEYRLTTETKKRILTSSIYGVDIDAQAVEVTKLSLLLKLLEGETGQLSLGFERVLPNLDQNIRCGNSLIGWDYFQGQMFPDEEELQHVNPFDWQRAFPHVFAAGGFDAVIGNPPYFNIDSTWGKKDPKLDALKRQYPEVYQDKTDVLFYFLAIGIRIVKGYLSFIISRAFMEAYKADKLRSHISQEMQVCKIIDFQNKAIFEGVGISTLILVLQKKPAFCKGKHYRLLAPKQDLTNLDRLLQDNSIFESLEIAEDQITNKPWVFIKDKNRSLFAKIDENSQPIGSFMQIGSGMQTGANNVFGNRTLDEIQAWNLEPNQYFKRAANSDIQPFFIIDRQEYLLFTNAFDSFKKLHPDLQTYLQDNSTKLKGRAAYKRGNCQWWQYTWPLNWSLYGNKRILTPYMAKSNRFALDLNDEFLSLTDTTVIFDSGQKEDLYYILGLLNTELLTKRYKSIGKLKGGEIYEYVWNSVSKMPIKRIDFSNPEEVDLHDKIVNLSKQIVNLMKSKTTTPIETQRKNEVYAHLYSQIDEFALTLYTDTY